MGNITTHSYLSHQNFHLNIFYGIPIYGYTLEMRDLILEIKNPPTSPSSPPKLKFEIVLMAPERDINLSSKLPLKSCEVYTSLHLLRSVNKHLLINTTNDAVFTSSCYNYFFDCVSISD